HAQLPPRFHPGRLFDCQSRRSRSDPAVRRGAQDRGVVQPPFGHATLLRQAADRKLPPWAADIDVASWAQYFLKYVISHPAVTCAIPGSTRLSHLVDNQAAGRGRLPDAATRRKMEEYWDAKRW